MSAAKNPKTRPSEGAAEIRGEGLPGGEGGLTGNQRIDIGRIVGGREREREINKSLPSELLYLTAFEFERIGPKPELFILGLMGRSP